MADPAPLTMAPEAGQQYQVHREVQTTSMPTNPNAVTTQGIVVILGVLVTIITLVSGIVAIMRAIRATKRENEADASARTKVITDKMDEQHKSVDDRVREIEFTIRDFMPRSDIEGRLEHLKNNRQTVEGAMQSQIEKLSGSVGGLTVQVGKLEERHEGMAAVQVEIKELVKELRTDMKAGFKEIVDNRKAA